MSTLSSALHDLALALLAAGTLVVIVSTWAAFAFRRIYDRLHLLTPITSLGAPLIGLALAIENGWTLTTGEILITVVLLAVSGPVLEAATGRVAAQREGLISRESPE